MLLRTARLRCCTRTLRQCTKHLHFSTAAATPFEFTPENFSKPELPSNLKVLDVPLTLATDESLLGYGHIVRSKDQFTTEKGNFEITPWPVTGWRPLDPHTGDEAGTVEGDFDVHWEGDYFYGHNLAVATENNFYLDGMGALVEECDPQTANGTGKEIYLWMSDYHPDGAQLFWNDKGVPFAVNLALPTIGDGVQPSDMRAFYVPAGCGVYIHPSTWHNGVYTNPKYGKVRFLTRQSKVHARVSVSWAAEFDCLLRVPLEL